MKIILMILLSTCLSIASSDYPRFKRKGMVQNGPPSRLPPPHQFAKKWGKPPQKPMMAQFMQHNRPPFPVQQPPLIRGNRPPGVNKPQIIPGFNTFMQHQLLSGPKFQQFPQKPQLPNKEFFKKPAHQQPKFPNIQAQFIQFPQEKKIPPKVQYKQEKPQFHSSPSIPAAIEHDYHIQTNSIPMAVNTIKQVGEKGPIHTIPAPNLTPADKPSNLEYRKPHYQHQEEVRYQQQKHYPQPNQHYQVSEPTDQNPQPVHRDQINAQTHYTNNLNQQYDQNGAQAYQNLQTAYFAQNNNLGVTMQETGNHGININFRQPGEDMLFSNSQDYQVVNAHFSTGQPNQNLHTQAIQSSYEQQQPQVLSQFIKPENSYVNQYQQEQVDGDKNGNAEPEYHSFNYDEQAHQAQAKSGLVTAGYSLGNSEDTNNGQSINSRSSSVDPLTQSQIIQSYFDTRSGNNVEPDAKPSASGAVEKEEPYYSALPNKEAADRLAKLQAAGKVNSSLMKLRNPTEEKHDDNMDTIYVPEENVADEKDDGGSKDQSGEYEDYSQEEESSQSEEDSGFGQKTKY